MEKTHVETPLEVVAAITAAIAAYLDAPLDSFVLTSVQAEPAPAPARTLGSVWAKAGVLETHLARRQFGIRTR
jgi:hypothetical protein